MDLHSVLKKKKKKSHQISGEEATSPFESRLKSKVKGHTTHRMCVGAKVFFFFNMQRSTEIK